MRLFKVCVPINAGLGPEACTFSLTYHFPTRSLYVMDSGNLVIRQIK